MHSEEDRRVESLDRAFLFSIGLTSFIFSLLQGLVGGWEALLLFVPLLFAGCAYPFYVGCLRGAVERPSWKESMLHRTRGWVYYSIGSTSYVALMVAAATKGFVPERTAWEWVPYYAILVLGLPISVKLIGLVRKVTNTSSQGDQAAIVTTMAAAFLIAAATFYTQDVVRQAMNMPRLEIPLFVLAKAYTILAGFLLFVLLERVAIAQCRPEGRLTWRLNLVNSPSRETHWLNDIATSMFVAFASHRTALRLVILSVIVRFAGGLLFVAFGTQATWIADGSSVLPLFGAFVMYSRVPVERMRSVGSDRREHDSQWSGLLDC